MVMNTVSIAPITHYTDSLRHVTERQQQQVDSLTKVISEYNDIPFDQLSVTIGIVAFIAALLVVLAQVIVSNRQNRHNLRAVEKQNQTQIDIALKQLTEQARENERRRSDQIVHAENATKLQKTIAQSQLVADVIAKSRHRWIQDLRHEVAAVISIANTLANPTGLKEGEDTKLFQSANIHYYRIQLLLHKGEENHDRLLELLYENVSLINSRERKDKNFTKKLDDNILQIVEAASLVSKEAWDTLKEEIKTGKIQ